MITRRSFLAAISASAVLAVIAKPLKAMGFVKSDRKKQGLPFDARFASTTYPADVSNYVNSVNSKDFLGHAPGTVFFCSQSNSRKMGEGWQNTLRFIPIKPAQYMTSQYSGQVKTFSIFQERDFNELLNKG